MKKILNKKYLPVVFLIAVILFLVIIYCNQPSVKIDLIDAKIMVRVENYINYDSVTVQINRMGERHSVESIYFNSSDFESSDIVNKFSQYVYSSGEDITISTFHDMYMGITYWSYFRIPKVEDGSESFLLIVKLYEDFGRYYVIK